VMEEMAAVRAGRHVRVTGGVWHAAEFRNPLGSRRENIYDAFSP